MDSITNQEKGIINTKSDITSRGLPFNNLDGNKKRLKSCPKNVRVKIGALGDLTEVLIETNFIVDDWNSGKGGVYPAGRNSLDFTSSELGKSRALNMAWAYQGNFTLEAIRPNKEYELDKSFRIGFAQTVRNQSIEATYIDGHQNKKLFKAKIKNKRDRINNYVPAPWYSNSDTQGHVHLDGKSVPIIFDSPFVRLSKKKARGNLALYKVKLSGIYDIFLAIYDSRKQLELKNLIPVSHISIELKRQWVLNKADIREIGVNDFNATGSQHYLGCGNGWGRSKPILIGEIANDALMREVLKWKNT